LPAISDGNTSFVIMAEYGSNAFAVQLQRNAIDAPLPDNKSQAMPAHRPNVGWVHAGSSDQLFDECKNRDVSLPRKGYGNQYGSAHYGAQLQP
jgi:hypothetical protein